MKKPTRPRAEPENDAATLQLGKDFEKEHALLNSEVLVLLQAHRKQKLEVLNLPAGETEKAFTPVFNKALAYCFVFSRYKTKEVVEEVRRNLDARGLCEFEMAQLANLCPESSEEAKSLIPSLSRLVDNDLQTIVDELASIRKFQS